MKNITNVFYEFLIALCCLMSSSALWAWEDMSMPRLHVEGRYLVDPHGNKVNLHGFAQTYSPVSYTHLRQNSRNNRYFGFKPYVRFVRKIIGN